MLKCSQPKDDRSIDLDVWDTPGRQRGVLPDATLIGTHGAIVMFDVTSILTFQNLSQWLSDDSPPEQHVPECVHTDTFT
jgi:GTPase SAR1 family protein